MVYKHPNTGLNQFVSYFESTFQRLQSESCKFYICEDLNTNFIIIDNDKKVSLYADFLCSYNATNLVNKVTRIVSGTIIDYIYTTVPMI